MSKKNKNILELTLEQLKVKFTKSYVRKLYNENPYQNTLFGLSNMLSDYNVKSIALKTKSIEELKSIDPPFLINVNGKTVLVNELQEDKVSCIWEKGKADISFGDFSNVWDGIILFPEANDNSTEPDYKEHKKIQVFDALLKNVSKLIIGIIFLTGFIANAIYSQPGLTLLSVINLIGIYIGCLLVQKQMYISNSHADKICSMLKKGNCNSVLNSPASKFMGVVGWSEIGLSYFISNILILILFPQLITYLVLVNVCALPYSFWSVWYQKYKVKQWCPLCLIVQVLLWILFIINFVFGYIAVPVFTIMDVLLTGCIYALPFLVIHFTIPKLNDKRHIEYLRQEINNLRLKPEVFSSFLKQQSYYNVDKSTSQIIWGNKEANLLITIVTNPHCAPCAMTHRQVEKLLNRLEDKICIQYIFSSFNEELEFSNKFLTAVYLSEESSAEEKKEIYNKWFEEGKYRRGDFFEEYKFDINSKLVISETDKHKRWKDQTGINGTPTILINGYELPYLYKMEDLIYFTDLKI